jgi:hypothetical protein
MLTNQIIFKESGQYDKEVIQRLRLERMGKKVLINAVYLWLCIMMILTGITRIASLDGCVSLIELNLSCNEVGDE